MKPPDNVVVLCVDEETGIRALDRTQPMLPLRAAKPQLDQRMIPMLDPSSTAGRSSNVGLMPESKIRLQVNAAVAAEAEGGRVGEGFQVAVCTGVVEQAF
jgi:hypothetical protein